MSSVDTSLEQIEKALSKLKRALNTGRSRKWCLKLWRNFVLERDGWKCIACDSTGSLFAHHIFRKTVFPQAQFMTGNGVALCRNCHGKVHRDWNGRPGPGEPFNARGGDDQDFVVDLYFAMELDAVERGIFRDDFYDLSDEIIYGLVALQGMNMERYKNIPALRPRIREARLIWEMAPQSGYTAMGEAILECLMKPATDFFDALDRRLYVVN